VLVVVFGRIELRSGPRPHSQGTARDAGKRSWARVLPVLTVVGVAPVLGGLLGVTVAGPGDHGPAGLPTVALLGYLLGTAELQLVRRCAAARRHA
jgi:hypothetical protein